MLLDHFGYTSHHEHSRDPLFPYPTYSWLMYARSMLPAFPKTPTQWWRLPVWKLPAGQQNISYRGITLLLVLSCCRCISALESLWGCSAYSNMRTDGHVLPRISPRPWGDKKNKTYYFWKNNSLKMVHLLHLLETVVELYCEFVVAFCSEILILG